MKLNLHLSKVVLYQHLGFLAIIAICYFNDLVKLPSLIFSDHPFLSLYRRSTLEMLLILAIWLLVANSTRRLLRRMKHLEDFMRVCAWCRRVDFKGAWMPFEDFLEQSFDTPTTHGICKECLEKQQAAINKARKLREKIAEEQATAG